jgi:hypothetical protein
MNAPKSSTTLPRLPRGLSFELSDLTLVLGWSDFHDVRMAVALDHCNGDEEYEEGILSVRFQIPPLVDVAHT